MSAKGSYVYVVKGDSTAEQRPVTLGQRQGDLVVVDGVKALIGSANFTEAAQLRNIEIGLVVIAEAVERHFEALIAGGHLQPLKPLSSRDRG